MPGSRQPLEFEWDEAKRRTNLLKHGIDFADATEVFADPKAFTVRSTQAANEIRDITIGKIPNVIIAVITTRRNGRLRIISARMARRSERSRYG
jgi:hypothetical protein